MYTPSKLQPHALALGVAGLALFGGHVFAADHADAPETSADPAADIADFHLWHTESDTIVASLTFAGAAAPGAAAVYDADVLYTIHLDNDGDNVSDVQIEVRFGQNADGEWGVQVLNLPGATAPSDVAACGSAVGHCGPVETVIDTGSGTRVFAGLRDDPTFADIEGFIATYRTGTVTFDSNNDTFAGTNATAIVVEFDADAATAGGTTLQAWATTSRK